MDWCFIIIIIIQTAQAGMLDLSGLSWYPNLVLGHEYTK